MKSFRSVVAAHLPWLINASYDSARRKALILRAARFAAALVPTDTRDSHVIARAFDLAAAFEREIDRRELSPLTEQEISALGKMAAAVLGVDDDDDSDADDSPAAPDDNVPVEAAPSETR